MTGPTILALDLALTKTGVAHLYPDGRPLVRTIKGRGDGHDRLAHILTEIGHHLAAPKPDLVVIEDLPPDAKSKAGPATIIGLAGLHMVVRHWLWAKGLRYLLVHQAHIKIYAAGKGSGVTKEDVLLAVERRFGHLAQVADNNQADALALLALARHAYGHPLADMPQTHARALSAVPWPELGGHRPLPVSPPVPAAAARKAGRRRDGVVAAQTQLPVLQEANQP